MKLNLPEKRTFYGPATLWKRLLSLVIDLFIIDFFILSFFGKFVENLLGGKTGYTSVFNTLQENASHMHALTAVLTIIVLLMLAYFVLLQYAVGQTIGGILLNIHVIREVGKNEFERPGFLQCILRNSFLIPVLPFMLLWIADPVYYFFAKKHQRLSEWLSRTKVVEKYEC